MTKFKELKNYLDEKKYKNSIQIVEKDVNDVLKIDKDKKLMTLDIPDDEIFKQIANVLGIDYFDCWRLDDGGTIHRIRMVVASAPETNDERIVKCHFSKGKSDGI